jgi:hypothetical protein
MQDTPPPTLAQMIEACEAVCEAGLRQVRLGNCDVFAPTPEQRATLVKSVGAERVG